MHKSRMSIRRTIKILRILRILSAPYGQKNKYFTKNILYYLFY